MVYYHPEMESKQITSLQNPLIKHFVKLRTSRAYRYSEKKVVLAGKKEVTEAKNLQILLARQSYSPLPTANETYFVSDAILKKVTGFETPEPLAAIVEMPKPVSLEKKGWILALDGISDPGNIGTLFRTALALGWEGVFLTPSCVDPFNDKAMRSGKGAALRLPLFFGTEKELIELGRDRSCLVATIGGRPLDSNQPKPTLLILGNEANGVSPILQDHFPKISIPIESIESLNVAVAGAILMYGLKQ